MKVSPSQQMRREDQKIIAKGNKAYKKQLAENQKDINERNDDFFNKKKHKYLTKRKRKHLR